MRRCYLCDIPIPAIGFRRWVDTSTATYGRMYVSRRGLAGSSTTGRRTGLRTLCWRCADQLDQASVEAAGPPSLRTRADRVKQTAVECFLILLFGFMVVHGIMPKEPTQPAASHLEASTRGATHD